MGARERGGTGNVLENSSLLINLLQCNSIIITRLLTAKMPKNQSKANMLKRTKSTSHISARKKSTKVSRSGSCFKISPLCSQQPSKVTARTANPSSNQLSFRFNPTPSLQQTQSKQFFQGPLSYRNSARLHAKTSLDTVPTQQKQQKREDAYSTMLLREKNEELNKENLMLRQRCCELQQLGLQDKEKIKKLIIRINQFKYGQFTEAKTQPPTALKQIVENINPLYQKDSFKREGTIISTAHLPQQLKRNSCQRPDCLQRNKYLQQELSNQRNAKDRLQQEKQTWQQHRSELKQQYKSLLQQVKSLRKSEL